MYPYDTKANLDTLNYTFWTDPARSNITKAAVEKGPDYLDIIGPLTLIDKTVGGCCFLWRGGRMHACCLLLQRG